MEALCGPVALNSTNLATAVSECPTCQQHVPMLGPWYDTIPQGHQLAHSGKVTTLCLSVPGGPAFHPHMDRYLYRHKCAFPACRALARAPVCGLWNSGPQAWYSTQRRSNQSTHFTAKEVQEWTHDHRFYWPCHMPHHPAVAGPIQHWSYLPKTQLKSQGKRNTQKGWGIIL